jgi:hypothetical protein
MKTRCAPVRDGSLGCVVGPFGRGRIDLPDPRDRLATTERPRFTELRDHPYAQIQKAKTGSTS